MSSNSPRSRVSHKQPGTSQQVKKSINLLKFSSGSKKIKSSMEHPVVGVKYSSEKFGFDTGYVI